MRSLIILILAGFLGALLAPPWVSAQEKAPDAARKKKKEKLGEDPFGKEEGEDDPFGPKKKEKPRKKEKKGKKGKQKDPFAPKKKPAEEDPFAPRKGAKLTKEEEALFGPEQREKGLFPAEAVEEKLFGGEKIVTSPSSRPQTIFRSQNAIFVIGRKEIERWGFRHVADFFRFVPGMDVFQSNGFSWGVSARGMNQEFNPRMLLLIDGRSAYTPSFGGIEWEQLMVNVEDIQRIEVIRGPGATIYGANAVNGVINIITREPEPIKKMAGQPDPLARHTFTTKHYGGSQATYGNFSRYTYQDGNIGLRTSFAYEDSRGIGGFSGTHNIDDDYTLFNGGVRVRVRPADLHIADAWIHAKSGRTQETGKPLLIPDDEQNFQNWVGAFRYTFEPKKLSEFTDVRFRLFYFHQHLHRQVTSDDFKRRNQSQQGLVAFGGIGADPFHELSSDFLVVSERRDQVEIDATGTLDLKSIGLVKAIFNGGASVKRTHMTFTYLQSPREKQEILAGYLQGEFEFVPQLIFVAGAKVENNNFVETQISPRFTFLVSPITDNTIRLSYARAYRNPAFIERKARVPVDTVIAGFPSVVTGVFGNPDFRPEKVDAYEIGYRALLFAKRVDFNVETYWNNYRNILSLSPNSNQNEISTSASQFQSIDKVRNVGIEISAQVKVLKEPGPLLHELDLKTFFVFQKAKNRSQDETYFGTPNLKYGGVVSATLRDRVKADVLLGFFDGVNYSNGGGAANTTVSSWGWLGVRVAKAFPLAKALVEVGVSGHNLLGKHREIESDLSSANGDDFHIYPMVLGEVTVKF